MTVSSIRKQQVSAECAELTSLDLYEGRSLTAEVLYRHQSLRSNEVKRN
jgi:hypothetical protein